VDILLLDAISADAHEWLSQKHTVHAHPEWAAEPDVLRRHTYKITAMVLPRQTVVNRAFLDFAPRLQVIARLHSGSENTDLEACRERGVRVIQPTNATIRSNAEYLLSALLLLYRRGVVPALAGTKPQDATLGRELCGSTVGLVGLAPAAHVLAGMLTHLGVRVIGYDPAIHHSADIWGRLHVEPVSLPVLLRRADAVSLQMLYASRYAGFLGDKVLADCKPGQVWVGVSRSALFDGNALAAALQDGRIESCMLDGAEAGFAQEGSPLRGLRNLVLTPRLGAHTEQARSRASWYVAHRMHEYLSQEPVSSFGRLPSRPADLELPAGTPLNSSFGDLDFIIR
jgi:phosphoglycerate dehydrogenase-like enzyme